MLLAVAVIFNVVLSVGFVVASNYLFDYLNTEIGDVGYTDQGLYVVPYVHFSGFQVDISHDIYQNGQVVNLGTLPTVILNYPYILFWVAIIGNLVFVAVAFFLHKTKANTATVQAHR
jgi:hypothetical protein